MEYLTTSPQKWALLKPFARENRKEMTFSEKIVWNFIRKRQLSVKFRRQQVIADFIVDFVCLDLKLVIEIDGESHNNQKEYDEERTKILNELGYKVIRFTNDEVDSNGERVENEIKRVINDLILQNQ
jgi:very-short-patch-repair endonuclease